MALGPQFRRFYHGTGVGIEGGVVLPSGRDKVAYASSSLDDARMYAATQALEQGRLFGSVYEVKPRNPEPSLMGVKRHVISREGLDVVDHLGFVNHEGEWANT